jgi:hypothetical protein
MIILDVSGSMGSLSDVEDPENPEGPHLTRLEAAIAAINKLLDEYAERGDVRVQIVKFSSGADQIGDDYDGRGRQGRDRQPDGQRQHLL